MPTEVYTLSLHDALPISASARRRSRRRYIRRRCSAAAGVRLPGNPTPTPPNIFRSEEHTSELQSQSNLVCRLLLEKKNLRREPNAITLTDARVDNRVRPA